MAKTKITENRDQKVKEERLEIRLSKAQKDAIKSNAQKKGLPVSNYILNTIFESRK